MSKHQASIPGSTEVEGHVHEEDTWSPADWDLAQIALVCLGGIIVFVVILLFVGGCQHADCRKVSSHENANYTNDDVSTREPIDHTESLQLKSDLKSDL